MGGERGQSFSVTPIWIVDRRGCRVERFDGGRKLRGQRFAFRGIVLRRTFQRPRFDEDDARVVAITRASESQSFLAPALVACQQRTRGYEYPCIGRERLRQARGNIAARAFVKADESGAAGTAGCTRRKAAKSR